MCSNPDIKGELRAMKTRLDDACDGIEDRTLLVCKAVEAATSSAPMGFSDAISWIERMGRERKETRPSWRCMSPDCQRGPIQDGECWLCPACADRLREDATQFYMGRTRVEQLALVDELKAALRVAACAISIASDWNIDNVQVAPPAEWGLEAFGEDVADGWCSTAQLARKLKEIAKP